MAGWPKPVLLRTKPVLQLKKRIASVNRPENWHKNAHQTWLKPRPDRHPVRNGLPNHGIRWSRNLATNFGKVVTKYHPNNIVRRSNNTSIRFPRDCPSF